MGILGFHRPAAASLPPVRQIVAAVPLWAIVGTMVLFFWAVTKTARQFVLRRRDADSREALAEQANNLLTGVAATFAFFVGFAISASWGAVTTALTAVERQATAVSQMAWEINNIRDRAESAALMDKLSAYASAVADEDRAALVKGATTQLPSATALDRFETALHTYADGPMATDRQASALVAAASEVSSTGAGVAAVANRTLPRPLFVLLMVVGVLSSILMGISTVTYTRPSLIFIWCLIPAVSITTVIALAYPFAMRSGGTTAPMQAVAGQLAGELTPSG